MQSGTFYGQMERAKTAKGGIPKVSEEEMKRTRFLMDKISGKNAEKKMIERPETGISKAPK